MGEYSKTHYYYLEGQLTIKNIVLKWVKKDYITKLTPERVFCHCSVLVY